MTYSTCVETTLEWSRSPPEKVSVSSLEMPCLSVSPVPNALVEYAKLLGNVYICAAVSAPAPHEYSALVLPYASVITPACATS